MRVELLAFTPLSSLQEAFPELGWRELLPHLCFTFAVEKVSRACSHQLVRHRTASFSQQSQRYILVEELMEKIVYPPSVGDTNLPHYKEAIQAAREGYQTLVDNDVPREDARFLLPNATETSMLVTMDGLALMHFLGLRCCNRAQWEIKQLSDKMLALLRMVEPMVFNNAGPYCYQLGTCPEGRYTCGKIVETREWYMV